jgi:hypothetical protein
MIRTAVTTKMLHNADYYTYNTYTVFFWAACYKQPADYFHGTDSAFSGRHPHN